MRENYRKQLESLSRELIAMGSLCESAIDMCIKVISRSEAVGDDIKVLEGEINSKERELENLCIKILLQQQPVASDLRFISAALKMVTDLERIGDNAADIAEVAAYIGQLAKGRERSLPIFQTPSDRSCATQSMHSCAGIRSLLKRRLSTIMWLMPSS